MRRRRPNRIALLLIGLALVAAAYGAVNVRRLRTAWLERRPLAELATGRDPLTRQVYARKLLTQGRADAAIPTLQSLASEAPSAETLTDLAHALAVAGKVDDARPALERARAVAPNDPILLLSAAWIDRWQGRLDVARQQAEAVTGLRPDEPEAWRLRGEIANAARDFDAAEAALRRSLALDDAVPATQVALAYTLSSRGKYREAADALRAALDRDPTDARVERLWGEALALSARTASEYASAITRLKARVAESPNDARLVWSLAQLELRANRSADAREDLRRTVTLNPREADAWFLLGEAERRLGNMPEAERAFARFRRVNRSVDRVTIARKRLASRPEDALRKADFDRAQAALASEATP